MNKRQVLVVAGALVASGIVGNLGVSGALADTIYRNYNTVSGEHLYTSHYEWVTLANTTSDWTQDSVTFDEPATGVNIYRVYNPNSGEHLFTGSAYEASQLMKIGWRSEGVAFHSGGQIPVYRLYNPAAGIGAHLNTANSYEKSQLIKVGWRYEGVAWYALGQGATAVPQKTVWHSNFLYQDDARWRNVRIGDSTLGPEGCGPTSIAMILNGFGRNYNPVQVAQTAHAIGNYNNPNVYGDGIDGQTILSTLNYYGMQANHITSESQLISELISGKPVIYGMEWLYTVPNASHFVVLSGYSNGYTTVHDPLHRIGGANSVDRLWTHPSQLSDDWNAGRPAWSVFPR